MNLYYPKRLADRILPYGSRRRDALHPPLKRAYHFAKGIYHSVRKFITDHFGKAYTPVKAGTESAALLKQYEDLFKVVNENNSSGKPPKMSIVSVLYNKENEIGYYLGAFFRQTYQGEFEIVLVDDKSSDNAVNVVNQYLENIKDMPSRPKVTVIKNETNLGNCNSRNIGISQSTGDIIVVIDCDCIVNKDFLSAHASAHALNDCDVVIGPLNMETNGKDPFAALNAYEEKPEKVLADCQLQDTVNPQSFLNCITRNFSINRGFISGNLFDPLFSYSEDPESGFGWEDVEMGYTLYKRGARIKFIPNAYSIHVSHPSSVAEETKAIRSLKNFRRLFEKHPDLLMAARRWVLDTYQKIIEWAENHEAPVTDDRRFIENQFQRFFPSPFFISGKRTLRILTYRWHCPHQYELYKLPHEFTLATGIATGFTNSWGYEQRPLRSNARFRPIEDLRVNDYDLAILHFDENVLAPENTNGVIPPEWGANFKWLRENLKIPMVAICHGTPQFYGQYKSSYSGDKLMCIIEEERKRLVNYLKDITVICNSYQAQREWGFKISKVIWHGFDPTEFPPALYEKGILTLGNAIKERPHYRGYNLYQQVFEDFPPEFMPSSLSVPEPHNLYEKASNPYAYVKFRNYVDEIRRYSIYFNPTQRSPMPRSRGEAMMCGLVTVSANNHDVDMFVKNGINGFYSNDPWELREYLLFLLNNPDKAREIGYNSRMLAMDIFNHDRYLHEWAETISEVLK